MKGFLRAFRVYLMCIKNTCAVNRQVWNNSTEKSRIGLVV